MTRPPSPRVSRSHKSLMTVVWQLSICATPVAGVVYVVRMGEEVARFAAQRTADTEQAEHFRRLLGGRKCEVRKLLEAERRKVASAFRAGNYARIRRHQRIVNVLEAELRTVERESPLLAEQALARRPPHGGDAPPRADDMFGGLLVDPWIRIRVAPWMFSTRAQPWYLTRPAAIAFAGAAATVVILGVLLALRTPTTAVETPTTAATTAPTRARPPATPAASSEPTTRSIPPSPPIAPPPSPASAEPTDHQPAIADLGPRQEPPPAEPTDPEPAIADLGPPEEPPPAEPTDPEPAIAEPPTT
jgi:hypothetical protein